MPSNYRVAGVPTSIKATPNPYIGLSHATGIPGPNQAATVARTGAMARAMMNAPKPPAPATAGIRKIKVKRRPGPFLRSPMPAGGFSPTGAAGTP